MWDRDWPPLRSMWPRQAEAHGEARGARARTNGRGVHARDTDTRNGAVSKRSHDRESGYSSAQAGADEMMTGTHL